ncbi:hypothetical protein D9611_012430 [Ephemerocybe angulata]|uniref:Ribonucleoside-diphosphate reductase n=1 Tax=Ephemerocybe angulata TaxID=980116 RepID=A0A8H5CDX4_9AGAR|nr:hypothetical protein D9611_012430 [Tulosesus angulatus]
MFIFRFENVRTGDFAMLGAKNNVRVDGIIQPFDDEKAIDIHRDSPELFDIAKRLTTTFLSKFGDIIRTVDLRPLLASTAASFISSDSIYGEIARGVELETIYDETTWSFSDAMLSAYNANLVSEDFLANVTLHSRVLDTLISDTKDSRFSYFALKVLQKSYLLKDGVDLLERPQFMWMRTAVQIHGSDILNVEKSYCMMSSMRFIPGSPILSNSGSKLPGLSSCYLLPADTDPGTIFDTLQKVSAITLNGGGIGLGIQHLPAKGSIVNGRLRTGIVPIIKLLDASLNVIDQEPGKRPGAMTLYIEPWHAEILSFVRMKRLTGPDDERAKNIFFALWTNDLFMQRVDENSQWSLFCPSTASTLISTFGKDFEKEYRRLEASGKAYSTIPARDLWREIILCQIESGGPSILFKDAINRTSNQQNLGVITQGNLCTEIVQYANRQETAVSPIASIVLPSFVTRERRIDYDRLGDTSVESGAQNHRAIGIGIQGLGDAFAMMGLPFDSAEAAQINVTISETIYFNAVDESCNLINVFGTYPTFDKAPASEGWLQPDYYTSARTSGRFNWDALRSKLKKGICNSLLTAYMPTADTSQLTGYSEGFEPITSMIVTREILTGQIIVIPTHLISLLEDLELWSEALRDRIVADNGSIQRIQEIPKHIRAIYKTSWEIDPETIVLMAADRAPYICQAQSMNIFLSSPSIETLSRLIFLGWKRQLKTGIYLLKTSSSFTSATYL